MSTFPGSPRLLRGGLVLIDPTTGSVLRIIALQYNPDTLTRSYQVQGAGKAIGDRPRFPFVFEGKQERDMRPDAKIVLHSAITAGPGEV